MCHNSFSLPTRLFSVHFRETKKENFVSKQFFHSLYQMFAFASFIYFLFQRRRRFHSPHFLPFKYLIKKFRTRKLYIAIRDKICVVPSQNTCSLTHSLDVFTLTEKHSPTSHLISLLLHMLSAHSCRQIDSKLIKSLKEFIYSYAFMRCEKKIRVVNIPREAATTTAKKKRDSRLKTFANRKLFRF